MSTHANIKFFMRLIVIAVAVFISVFAGLVIWNKGRETLIAREISQVQKNIAARDDGSKLTFNKPTILGDNISIQGMKYRDGVTGILIEFEKIEMTQGDRDLLSGKIQQVQILKDEGEPTFIEEVSFVNFDPTQDYSQLENVSFDEIILKGFEVHGHISYKNLALLKIAQVDIQKMHNALIEEIIYTDTSIGSPENPEVFQLGQFRSSNVKAETLYEIFDRIEKGFIPIDLIPLAQLQNTTDLNQLVRPNRQPFSSENAEDVLDFFIQNAPSELQEFLGDRSGKDLMDRFESLDEKTDREKAIELFDFFIEGLKNSE